MFFLWHTSINTCHKISPDLVDWLQWIRHHFHLRYPWGIGSGVDRKPLASKDTPLMTGCISTAFQSRGKGDTNAKIYWPRIKQKWLDLLHFRGRGRTGLLGNVCFKVHSQCRSAMLKPIVFSFLRLNVQHFNAN